MPEITIELNEGRSIEQKRALCKGITEVVVETCKVPADRVVITIHETQLVNKAVGGVLFADHLPTTQRSDNLQNKKSLCRRKRLTTLRATPKPNP